MTDTKFKSVRIYEPAHAALAALTEQARKELGYRNLTMTEYLSNLILQQRRPTAHWVQPAANKQETAE